MVAIRLAGVIRESIVDGPGFRFVVFTQGCPHHCPGCQNPGTHDPAGGYDGDTDRLFEEFCKNPLLAGMTFSGGDPFLQPLPLADLAHRVHEAGKTVITYTGYTMDYLLAHLEEQEGWRELLLGTDRLVDGPFIESLRSPLLHFRGSSNQRVLDPAASLAAGYPVEAEF